MTWLVLSLFALGAHDSRSDFQLMISPAFQAFAQKGDALCPSRKLRYLHPADLDLDEETFLTALPRPQQRRIGRDSAQFRGCPPAGLSCPAQRTLKAIIKNGELDSFVRSACAAKQ